ncbi:MAG: hypothetical protein ACKOFI_01395 [Phycisphaerales bacterium]
MIRLTAAAALALGCAGCSIEAGGTVDAVGAGDTAIRLSSQFETGTFAIEPAQTTVVFSDIPSEDLARGTARNGRFLHVEVLWRPRPGKTPIEPSSTNLSIRFVVVSNGEVGVYVGGGFGFIRAGRAGDGKIEVDITGSSISLVDKTPGFVDLLSPAEMTGTLGAFENADNARATRRAASQFVTNRLGKVRWVGMPAAAVTNAR